MAGVNMPSGIGGLVRYNEEYDSKFNLKPGMVILLIGLIILFRIALPIFFKIE